MSEPPGRPDSDAIPPRQWLRIATTYVVLLVVPGVVFGLLTAPTDRPGTWWFHGLFFGVIMSAVLGTMVVAGQRGNTGSWSPRRAVDLEVPADVATARRQVFLGLHQLQARIGVDDGSRLSARTGITWKTWGTRIDVAFDPGATGRQGERGRTPSATAVSIRVRPRLRTTLIDYGAAHRIVDTLTWYLTPMAEPGC